VDSNKDGLLYTTKEVVEGIIIKQEDEMEVTTNLGVNSNKRFNINLNVKGESDFND
jgi:hypothetical protein